MRHDRCAIVVDRGVYLELKVGLRLHTGLGEAVHNVGDMVDEICECSEVVVDDRQDHTEATKQLHTVVKSLQRAGTVSV